MVRRTTGGSLWARIQGSLHARMVGAFLLLSSLTLALVAALAYRSARESLARQVVDHLESVAQVKAGELNRWVDGQRKKVELLAELPGVAAAAGPAALNPDELRAVARAAVGDGEDLQEVFFLTADGGRVVASSDAVHEGSFHTRDLFFLEGREGTFVQNVHPSPRSARPALTIAAPILGPDGEALALVAAELNLARMDGIVLSHLGPGTTTQAYLITTTSDFVSASRFGREEFRRGVSSPGIDAALAGMSGVDSYRDYRGRPVIGAYRWIPERELALLVETSQTEAYEPARALLRTILLVGLAATLFLTVGVWWIAEQITNPIAAAAGAATRLAEGDFDVSVPEGRRDEVGALGRAFNSMAARLKSSYADLQGQIDVSNRALSALRENKALLESIVHNSHAPVAVTSERGTLLLTNDAMARLLGRTSGDLLGMRASDLLTGPPGEVFCSAREEAFTTGRPVERDVTLRVDGEKRTYHCVWFPLLGEAERPFGVGLIAADLTARIRAEEDRARYELELRHSQKLESLGVLAGGIAHDFNNLLAAILGHAELARESRDARAVEESLGQVVEAAHRAAELTNQMLAYAGRASLRVETVDLNDSLRSINELMSVSLPKTVAFRTLPASEPVLVEADPSQIAQVLMNLVTNAGQAIGDRPGHVTVRTRRADIDGRTHAVLTVTDDGCGVPDEVREHIFDPFFSTKDNGHGLGLAAVAGIVSGLGGSIEVESEVGRGTTFTVTLPAVASGVSSDRSAATPSALHARRAEGTVLVVDDEEAVRGLTRKVLERAGFEVLEARDGPSGLAAFQNHREQLAGVVLDMSMPGMGGADVCHAIRNIDPATPVLIMSGYDPSDVARSFAEDPRVDCIQKPFRPAHLVEALTTLMRS